MELENHTIHSIDTTMFELNPTPIFFALAIIVLFALFLFGGAFVLSKHEGPLGSMVGILAITATAMLGVMVNEEANRTFQSEVDGYGIVYREADDVQVYVNKQTKDIDYIILNGQSYTTEHWEELVANTVPDSTKDSLVETPAEAVPPIESPGPQTVETEEPAVKGSEDATNTEAKE